MKRKLAFLASCLLTSTMLLASPHRTSASDYYWPNDFSNCASSFTDNAEIILSTHDQDVSECDEALNNCLNGAPDQAARDQCGAQYDECAAAADSHRDSNLDTEDGLFQGCLGRVDTRPADYDHCQMARDAAARCDSDISGEFVSQWIECNLASGIGQCQ
jgi:hypothetical protein